MLKRKNQLSVGENIWEAFFVFEKIEARGAASTGPAFGNEESKCLIWELRERERVCVCVLSVDGWGVSDARGQFASGATDKRGKGGGGGYQRELTKTSKPAKSSWTKLRDNFVRITISYHQKHSIKYLTFDSDTGKFISWIRERSKQMVANEDVKLCAVQGRAGFHKEYLAQAILVFYYSLRGWRWSCLCVIWSARLARTFWRLSE